MKMNPRLHLRMNEISGFEFVIEVLVKLVSWFVYIGK